MGFSYLPLNVSSTVKWGNRRLRVALVLDNTGSMADNNKIGALKTATNNLLTQLKNAVVNNGDVYVSIVPFVKDVNVGPVNYNQNWIDWTEWDASNGSCSSNWYNNKSSCLSHGKTWTPDNHNTWNGCVVDRGAAAAPSALNTDTNVTPPTPANTDTMFAAEQYGSCPQALMPLSYNWSGMTTLVNNMSPGGNTNQAIGLALGWMSLVGGGPFPTPPAMDSELPIPAGHHSADRWLEHRGPLVHQPVLDQRTAGDHLRQRQGRRHHALRGAGQYRRRSDLDAAAELRERFEQVLPAHVVVADHHDVQSDRHRTRQPAGRQIRHRLAAAADMSDRLSRA